MTKNKQAKWAARAYGRMTGVSYTAARRATGGGGGGSGGPGGPGGGPTQDAWDDFEPKSLSELIAGAPQAECDRFIGEDIRGTSQPGDGLVLDLDLPRGSSEPSVHAFHMDEATTTIDVDEEFEGGTLACNVMTTGTLTVQVLMAKGDAVMAKEAGQVRIYDADFNRHYSAVLFDVEVEVTFHAILNPEYEGVEDFRLDGMSVIGA